MMIKKVLVTVTSVVILSLALISTVQAKDYSKRTTGYNLSVASGTIKVHGNAIYHSSGNTRWSYYWEAYSGNNIKSCFVKNTRYKIPYDSRLILVGDFSATNYSYISGTATKQVTFDYKNGSISYH